MPLLGWPLPAGRHPIEPLQFRQHLRGGRGRDLRLRRDVPAFEPLAIPHQERVPHLRATT